MRLNDDLREYLEKKDGERIKQHEQELKAWLFILALKMQNKVRRMMGEGLNYISLKYTKEMWRFHDVLTASRIAHEAKIDTFLIRESKWDHKNLELDITFQFPNQI